MKKNIVLKNYSLPEKNSMYTNNKMYHVYLGNNRMYFFTAEYKVKKFLEESSKMINHNLYVLNQLYSDSFREFREFWFYADNYQIQKINNMYKTIDTAFMRSVRISHEINVFVFRNMFLIIQELIEANTILIEEYTKKNQDQRIKKVEFINDQLNFIESKLKHWNHPTSTKLTEFL